MAKTIILSIRRLMLILWQLQPFAHRLNIAVKNAQHAPERIFPNLSGQLYVDKLLSNPVFIGAQCYNSILNSIFFFNFIVPDKTKIAAVA